MNPSTLSPSISAEDSPSAEERAEDSPSAEERAEDSPSAGAVGEKSSFTPKKFGTYLLPEERDGNISVSLAKLQLWEKFNHLGTEMIITKAGR